MRQRSMFASYSTTILHSFLLRSMIVTKRKSQTVSVFCWRASKVRENINMRAIWYLLRLWRNFQQALEVSPLIKVSKGAMLRSLCRKTAANMDRERWGKCRKSLYVSLLVPTCIRNSFIFCHFQNDWVESRCYLDSSVKSVKNFLYSDFSTFSIGRGFAVAPDSVFGRMIKKLPDVVRIQRDVKRLPPSARGNCHVLVEQFYKGIDLLPTD